MPDIEFRDLRVCLIIAKNSLFSGRVRLSRQFDLRRKLSNRGCLSWLLELNPVFPSEQWPYLNGQLCGQCRKYDNDPLADEYFLLKEKT